MEKALVAPSPRWVNRGLSRDPLRMQGILEGQTLEWTMVLGGGGGGEGGAGPAHSSWAHGGLHRVGVHRAGVIPQP